VDSTDDIRDFLSTRRARITPEQVGLPVYGRRRVPGLRREEVATLAGVSVDYYNRLERGNLAGVSDSILEAIAGALQLDEAEHAYLYDLARAASPTPRSRRPNRQPQVRPSIQRILAGMTEVPAVVRTGRLDIVAASRLGYALFSPLYADRTRPPNFARFNFLDPRSRDFWVDWDGAANVSATMLRTEAGRNPNDRALSELVGELSTRSDEFRKRWAAHDVRLHQNGSKNFHHPVVGDLTLVFDEMELSAATGLTLSAYTAEPGTASEDALKLLASWASTQDSIARETPADETVV
jgi:transcriptional regulator with XRE-family HTH domain